MLIVRDEELTSFSRQYNMNTYHKTYQATQKPKMAGFGSRGEKGSREWSSFDAIRDDAAHAYPSSTPRHPIVIEKPGHVLRIIHPPRR